MNRPVVLQRYGNCAVENLLGFLQQNEGNKKLTELLVDRVETGRLRISHHKDGVLRILRIMHHVAILS